MIQHGDAIISGVTEEKPENRPKCGYKIEEKHADGGTSHRPCGSEEGLRMVHGEGRYSGRPKNTPVCEKHRLDAWRTWNVTGEDPMPKCDAAREWCLRALAWILSWESRKTITEE